MSLSIKERKILWARSGNVCGFPGCSELLVQWLGQDDQSTVVGVEAHIIPRSPDGPRGDGKTEAEESATNYLLVCPTHHRVIDERPDVYDAAKLCAIKEAHEAQVRQRLETYQQALSLSAAEYRSVCAGNRAVQAWRLGLSTLIVCSFGGDPEAAGDGRWTGAGLQFLRLHDSGAEQLYTSWEVDPDILYWVQDVVLHIVQHTYDPASQGHAPFVEHRFNLERVPASVSRRVLLAPPANALERIDSLLATLNSPVGSTYSGEHEIVIYELRNAGLVDPARVIAALEAFRSQLWCDGAIAETVTSVQDEFRLVQRVRAAV